MSVRSIRCADECFQLMQINMSHRDHRLRTARVSDDDEGAYAVRRSSGTELID